jgi:hypothetical protein
MKKSVKTIATSFLVFSLIFFQATTSAQRFSITPSIRLGVLLTPPTPEELDYNPDIDYSDNFDMNPFNYGLGLQGLFGVGSTSSIRLGVDLGFKRVFSSTMNFDNTYIGLGISENLDREHAIDLELVFDKAFGKRFHLQAGAGPYFSIWKWTYDYNGPYAVDHQEDGGVAVNFGFLVAGSFDVYKKEHISIPVSFRLDGVIRYGILLAPMISTGITF